MASARLLAVAVVAVFVVGLVVLPSGASAHTAEEWGNRTIYQLLTDRFAGVSTPCPNLNDYCGGTFLGVISQLDYIQGMGFDAIWISPVITNTPGGYHGYWAQDFNTINPYFGTAAELTSLVEACHDRDMWVMVDVVANHAGPIGLNFSAITPYSTAADYHRLCQVTEYTCFANATLFCRLDDLPDLDQSNAAVNASLLAWISSLITTYDFDGIRADTVMYIDQDFWVAFQEAAGVYIVGEVWSDVECCIAYQQKGVDGILSYPMFYALRSGFQQGQSLNVIQSTVQQYEGFPNAGVLGTFVDNQDNSRFLYENVGNVTQYKNALVYVLLSNGIPIVYYGTEQEFHGGNDPLNREILWPTQYNTSAPMYQFLKSVVSVRKEQAVWKYPQVQRYSTDNFYAFTRGLTFVALSNLNYTTPSYPITYQPYPDGTVLCNALAASGQPDCVTVSKGQFEVTLEDGLPKIYVISTQGSTRRRRL